jgi:transcriptional regulator with XRE-family HTH domain
MAARQARLDPDVSEIGKRLGRRIRDLRTQRVQRWTQEELADRAGISVSFLSMIERGERIPHVETLAAIATALDVSLSELFSGTDREERGTDDLLRPLEEFVRSHQLTAKDIEKLLGVARALFHPNASGS